MVKLAKWIYGRLKSGRVFASGLQKSRERMKRLYPGEDWQEHLEQYYTETIVLVLKIGAVGCLILVTGFLYGLSVQNEELKALMRNSYGEGAEQIEVEVQGQGGFTARHSLEVREREFTEEEVKLLYERICLELGQIMQGENASLAEVEQNLYFPEEVSEYPFWITWESSDTSVISDEGEILRQYRKEPVNVTVTATLEYGFFEAIHSWEITVLPGLWTEEEIWKYHVERALQESDEKSLFDEQWLLPEEVNGQALAWEAAQENFTAELAGLFGIGILLVVWGRNNDLQRKLKQRDLLLEEEYSTVVTKMTLYLGAGMTVKSAWKKTADIQIKRNPKSAAAQEMLLALREMNSGIYENQCYENFGLRCGRQEYVKLGSLLSQNLRKGNSELLLRLREEALLAGENKKHLVRRRGEEASTKLIGPMVLLLGISLVLIMVPAFSGIG